MTNAQIDRLIELFDEHADSVNDEAVCYERGDKTGRKESRDESIRIRTEFVKLLESMK